MAEFKLDLKKILNDRRFRIFGGCALGLIALVLLTAAATPNSVNIYINNGNSCKIARKIKLKDKKQKRSKKS